MSSFKGVGYLPLNHYTQRNAKDDRSLGAHKRKRSVAKFVATAAAIFVICGFLSSFFAGSSTTNTLSGLHRKGKDGLHLLQHGNSFGQLLSTYFPAHFVGPSPRPTTPSLRLAIIVKTGAGTAYSRLPYHLYDIGNAEATFPGPVRQVETFGSNIHLTRHFVSDHEMTIGTEKVIDVLANLTERYSHQELFSMYNYLQVELASGRLPQHGDRYHLLDRYKFLAMHQYVFEQDPTADFHLAMDDDTVMFYPGVVRWLASSGYKGQEPHYLGTRKGEMADGGAGYILSRATLEALFVAGYATSNDDAKPLPLSSHPEAIKAVGLSWCGDCSLAGILGHVLKGRLPERRLSGGGWNFAYSLDQLVIVPENWHHPLFSIHHLNGKQMVELRQLEAEIARSMPSTDTPRVCDVFLALRPRFFEKVFPDNDTSKAVDTKAALNKDEPAPASQTFVKGGDDLKDMNSGLVEPKDEAWTKYSPAYPIVSSQVGPMLRVDNWSADNPDNHANMTLCKGPCLDGKVGDDDADRCSSACSDVVDCLSWTFHHQPRTCYLFHNGFLVGRKFDGNAAGYHIDRIQRAFGSMPCSDETHRRQYDHRDMHADTYFPEDEGWTREMS